MFVKQCHTVLNLLKAYRLRDAPGDNIYQDRQYMYNVTLRRIRAAIVAVEKQ
jgi:hypothetical protein